VRAEFRHGPQATDATVGTGIDVLPGKPLQQVGRGLGGTGGRGRDIELLTASTQLPTTCAVGQDAVVANADEAVREDVQQETAQELMNRPAAERLSSTIYRQFLIMIVKAACRSA
jgi:hypothetical protein